MELKEAIEMYLSVMEAEETLKAAHDKVCGENTHVATRDQIILNSEGIMGLVDELIMQIGQHVVLRPQLLVQLLEESSPPET